MHGVLSARLDARRPPYPPQPARATPPPGDALLIRRGEPPKGCQTGAARRRLPPSFFDNASARWGAAGCGLPLRVLRLEGMSLQAQVRLFAGARLVVARHGAALSNLLWARPGTLAVEVGAIFRPCYKPLARRLGLFYVHVRGEGFARTHEAVLRVLGEGFGCSNSSYHYFNTKNTFTMPWAAPSGRRSSRWSSQVVALVRLASSRRPARWT